MKRVFGIIIPTLNEEQHIRGLLRQFARSPASQVADILVADGGSTDATRAIVIDESKLDKRIRLIDNPDRIQSAGINRAVNALGGSSNTILRVDAHATYPDDFVDMITHHYASTDADMISVRLRTAGSTCMQRAIAVAGNSKIGSGSSAHRVGGFSGYVDHGHHAAMDLLLFNAVGRYDENFVANEDAELDYRIRQIGGKIWLAGDVEVVYFPRKSLRRLFTQYWRYGTGRAMTFLKHRERLKIRQLLPPALATMVAFSIAVAPFSLWFAAFPIAYTLLVLAVSLSFLREHRSVCTFLVGPAIMVMHLAWGSGFLTTLALRGGLRSGLLTSRKQEDAKRG
jgi:succinoglycan biosynthesis protein ExoA